MTRTEALGWLTTLTSSVATSHEKLVAAERLKELICIHLPEE